MTVKQLMTKLKKLPEDATVAISNTNIFVEGLYKATDIDFDEMENEVEICSDYKYRKNYYTGKWEK